MATKFSHSSPSLSPSRHQWADALVTFAVMAWFTASLAWMVGELHAFPATPVTQSAATRELPTALPQASTSLGNSAHPRMKLI